VLGASADLYGSDKVLLDVTESLADEWQLLIVLPAAGPLLGELEGRGLEYVVLPDFAMRKRNMTPLGALRWTWRVVRVFRQLCQLHRDRPFALVYSNTLAVPVGVLVKWRCRIPHLWHVHEVLEGPAWFCWILCVLLRFGSDRVICVSRAVMERLTGRRPKLSEKCTVIYNGVVGPAQPVGRATETGHDSLAIGCVGRIYPRKGHSLLLEAIAQARSRGFRCDLRIFGTTLPGEESHLTVLQADARRLQISESVEFLGFVDDPALVYSKFDVLVLPSIEPEALPLACIEAQAWGLPVIAPNEGGPTEIVVDGETGLLFEPRDVGALARAIEFLAADPATRQRFGRAGRHRVEAEFEPLVFRRSISSAIERTLAES
jgi:glycosyltransferase involved in cell wall biosynthesis